MLGQVEEAHQLQSVALAVEDGAQVAGPNDSPTCRPLVGGQLKRRFLAHGGGLGRLKRERGGNSEEQADSQTKSISPQHGIAPKKQAGRKGGLSQDAVSVLQSPARRASSLGVD